MDPASDLGFSTQGGGTRFMKSRSLP